ncbi:hypothetical protein R3W88_024281 [Solanum pinnatisectum]|uniref:Retrotransposon gag domain-containing protein n=1 Tax=Solanum pinnatisectum TaxID=50273 RepID=A0AAV9M0Q1_9SOLN|nr:hypothetical protein R3W88_024281 [Solanum pinnatisectum]
MARSSSKEVIKYNPELEKSLHLLKKELAERLSGQYQRLNIMGDINAGNRDQMDQNDGRAGRLLGDYAKPNYNGMQSNVTCPRVAANNFEIKHSVLQAIKNNCVFRGKQNEDPTSHLMDFDKIMNNFHYNGASDDAIYLRIWLRSLPLGSIQTWDKMTTKFLDKYFSLAKIARKRKEINNFSQLESETVFEAWEKFKELLRKWLSPVSWRILNDTVEGLVMKKTPEKNHQRQQYQPHEGQHGNQSSLEEMFKRFITKVDERFKIQGASIQNLEKQEKLDKYFGKFLEMQKELHVNIPFTEVITQMPGYAKFLKEILSNKRKLEETSVVKLNAHCSAILKNKLPKKCGDPGRFTIPCAISTARFEKSLCDSGASRTSCLCSYSKSWKESSES